MIFQNKKRGAADLLLEVLLSAIIFFVIIAFLFMIKIPLLQINAEAHVISADAALSCELSLANVLKSESPKDISYADWLVNSFTARDSKELDAWKTSITNIFDKAFYGDWDLNISLPNGSVILSAGKIIGEAKNEAFIFNCTSFVPYQSAYAQFYCSWAQTINATDKATAAFETPDGEVSCEIIDDGSKLGFKTSKTCNLQLAAKNVFEEDILSTIEEDPAIPGAILMLPIKVNNADYEITIEETSKAASHQDPVTLAKVGTLDKCSLRVNMRTTNVTA